MKENDYFSFVSDLSMKNASLHSMLNAQYIVFNLPIPQYVALE